MTTKRVLTAAERVQGWRGNWYVYTWTSGTYTRHDFSTKKAALGFAASMARVDRKVAQRRAAARASSAPFNRA